MKLLEYVIVFRVSGVSGKTAGVGWGGGVRHLAFLLFCVYMSLALAYTLMKK